MPELPEVERVRAALDPLLAGRRILEVRVAAPKLIARPDAEAFCTALAGARILGLRRRGKFLCLPLEGGARVLLHLRMTGGLLAEPAQWPPQKHTHVTFSLDDGTELRYADSRRFGRFWLIGAGEEDIFSGAQKLGPEPFDPALDAAYLQRLLCRSRRPVKQCLLDQAVVAGIGNIYADEILFDARIRPSRPAASLTAEEWARLAEAIPRLMGAGVENRRMAPQDYQATRGGEYHDTAAKVYGRAGRPCPRCGAALQLIRLAGRSSCFCPCCQPGQAGQPDAPGR